MEHDKESLLASDETCSTLEGSDDEWEHPARSWGLTDFVTEHVAITGERLETTPYTEKYLRSPAAWIFWISWLAVGFAAPCLVFVRGLKDVDNFFVDDVEKLRSSLALVATIPVVMAAFPMFFPSLWNMSIAPYLLLALSILIQAVGMAVRPEHARIPRIILENFLVSIGCFNWLRVWDYVDHIMHDIVLTEWDLSQEKVIAKWRNITHSVGVTSSGDKTKDWCIGLQSTATFADVIYSRLWMVVYMGAKAYGFLFFLSFVCLRDQVEYVLALGVLLFLVNATIGAYTFWPKVGVLVKLFLHKPFWVGELVSIGTDATFIVAGFIEHISLSYIIVRNFESKQVFVPIEMLTSTCVHNWSRRPTKPVKERLTVDGGGDPKAVNQLCQTAQRWIDNCKQIDAKGYTKCCIVGLAAGFDLEIIFFPRPGVHKNELRQEFLVALKGMANALNLKIVATVGVSVYSSGTASLLGQSAAAASFAGLPQSFGSS